MESTEVLYRALGVPGLVTPNNQARAAAASLRKLADVGTEEKVVFGLATGLEAASQAALLAVRDSWKDGELDPLIGGYGDEPLDFRHELLVRCTRDGGSVMAYVDEMAKMIDTALDRLVKFARGNPDMGWVAGLPARGAPDDGST